MASQYSHLHFFRKVPNSLLIHYLRSVNAFPNLDWLNHAESETDVKPMVEAVLGLDDGLLSEIEADFQAINALANDGGVLALVDEAMFHDDEAFVEELSAYSGFHAKVMWAFLERPKYWRGATLFKRADIVSPSFWKKRNDLPAVPPNVDDSDIEALATTVSAVFRKEGRGKNCKVEPYRRNDREYFFAYPEDFAQTGIEWESNTLKSKAHHPAFEIIFVYREVEGSLDIYAPRNTKAVPALQKAFAKTILSLDTLPDGTIDNRVYELAPAGSSDFEFTIPAGSTIQDIVVTRMRLKLRHGERRRVTLEADTLKNPKAVYDLRDELNPPSHDIDQLSLKVLFEPVSGKRSKTKTFNITYPNSCALNHDGTDLEIRKILASSGLEPKALEG